MKAAEVLEKVRRLESEHGEAGALHDEAEQIYSKWIAQGGLSSSEGSRLLTITEAMQRLYLQHIHVEEDVVFPFAARQLDRNALAEMGSEFKLRRQRN
jgi:hemerythrin-like domain-containing protein